MGRLPIFLAAALVILLSVPASAEPPQWTVRDIDAFQDNFASDGTTTGTVRADMAADILPPSSPGILPGDSSVVVVIEPDAGLATDMIVGGKAVYCYVAVCPQGQPTKTGAGLSGGARWPFVDTQVVNGITWTKLRFDHSIVTGNPVPDNYCIDLNDNLFVPGDTIFFFYSAKSADVPGTTNYYSLEIGTTSDITVAAAFAMEFTCLPAGGWRRGGDLMYIDSAEDGAQIYWDSAFRIVHFQGKVDRYDVRGAASGANNRLASRVVNVQTQLNECYSVIFWDCGSLPITLGDGSGTPQKTDDYLLLNTFLGNLDSYGGVTLYGDDVAEQLASYSSQSATDFHTFYMPFTLVSGDHAPAYGLTPKGIHWPGRCLADDCLLYGAGQPAHDFDVLWPTGSSTVEMTYGPASGNNGAVLLNVNGNAGVALSGFGFASVRDDEQNGISDRAKFFRDLSNCAGVSPFPGVTAADPTPMSILAPNYPNPFNPQTTIAFSLAERGAVSIKIYDVAGGLVRTLLEETRGAGSHAVTWDGRDDAGQLVSSGVYFYRLETKEFSQARRMVLLK